MRMFLLKTLICFLGSRLALADTWLCKEASSVRSGNTILACGIGTAISLEDARNNALKSAKQEFHQVCNASEDCRSKDHRANAKRTDCQKKSETEFTCYRAIEFEILNKDKRDITVDIDAVESQIADKQSELRMLRLRLEQQKQLNKLDEQIEVTKSQLETDVDALKDKVNTDSVKNREYGYSHLNKPWSLGFQTFYSTYPSFSEANSALGIGIRVERRFLKGFGLQIDLNYGSDFYSKDPEITGQASSTRTFRGLMAATELAVGFPIYFGYQIYLKPTVGTISLSRTDKQIDYGALGTKSNSTDINHSRGDSFYGIGVGYVTEPVDAVGSKYYFELNARCVGSCSSIQLNSLAGLIFSF
jgi:hypothetical protein